MAGEVPSALSSRSPNAVSAATEYLPFWVVSPSATERQHGNNKNNCEDNLSADGSQPRAGFRRAGLRSVLSKLFFKLYTLIPLSSLAHSIPRIEHPRPDGLRRHGRIGRAEISLAHRHLPHHPQQNENSAQIAAAAWLGFANPNPMRATSPTTNSITLMIVQLLRYRTGFFFFTYFNHNLKQLVGCLVIHSIFHLFLRTKHTASRLDNSIFMIFEKLGS